MNAIEKIKTILKPFAKGDNIEGKFVIKNNSIEFVTNSTTFIFDEDGDLIMTDKELLELCQLIISASLYWTGEDEEKNPQLKKIRTLAKYYLENLSE